MANLGEGAAMSRHLSSRSKPSSFLHRTLLLAALLAGPWACSSDGALPGAETSTQVDELMGGRCERGGPCARSRFVGVRGSFMHYREAGDRNGPPVLLLHGQPTWSYLYRNIIPHLPAEAHIIAPDSIGYGFSGRPEIDYSWSDHVDYLESFIEELDLRDVVLVVHDMGSFQGLAYAQRHPENVRGIVMMESVAGPLPPLEELAKTFPAGSPGAHFVEFLRVVKTDPVQAQKLVVEDNVFIEELLPELTHRELDARTMAAYRLPFRTEAKREKLLTIPLGIPVGGVPADNHAMVSAYAQYLATSSVPKLVLYGEPGLIFPPAVAQQMAQVLPNTRAESIGASLHFLQEDQPLAIAAAVSRFLQTLK